MTEEQEVCGMEHPEQPGVFCERSPCWVYHRSGPLTWTQGARQMPRRSVDPVAASGILQRTWDKARRTE